MSKVVLMAPRATTHEPYKEVNWIFDIIAREKRSQNISQAKNWYIRYIEETRAGNPDLQLDQRFFLEKYWQSDALVRFTYWLNKQQDSLTSFTRYAIYKNVRVAMDWSYELGITSHIVYHAPMFKGAWETDMRASYSESEQQIINTALSRWVNHAKKVSVKYEMSGKGISYCKPNNAPLEIDGNIYTLQRAEKTFGVRKDEIGLRRRNGWTDKQSVGLEPRSSSVAEPIISNKSGISNSLTVEGIYWPSLTQAGQHYGIGRKTISRRLRLGATPEQAVGLEPIYSKRGSFESTLHDFEVNFDGDPLKMLSASKVDRTVGAVYTPQVLMSFFMKVGVWPYIDRRLILPLAAELSRLTGLNAESVASLSIESYQPKHPLTNQPCIRYTKVRSGSTSRSDDKDLHLALLEVGECFIEECLQTKVAELIELVITLTSKIRSGAIGETARRLFIYEHDSWYCSLRTDKQVTHIIWGSPSKEERMNNPSAINASRWTTAFCRENGLYDLLGKEFKFNISRFRATLINNMVKDGADIFDIQSAMGHSSVQTTALYLSQKELDPTFLKVMRPALEAISNQSFDDSHSKFDEHEARESGVGFTETLCGVGCKDAFNPSKTVRELTGHIEGSLCKYWNMCLLCEQSSVTENGLPKIIAYKWKLEEALSDGKPNMQGRKELYSSIIEIIQDLIAPGHHYPENVLKEAEYLASELDDEALDHLVWQGF